MNQWRLNQHLIKILLHVNLVVIDMKSYRLINIRTIKPYLKDLIDKFKESGQ